MGLACPAKLIQSLATEVLSHKIQGWFFFVFLDVMKGQGLERIEVFSFLLILLVTKYFF